MKRLRGRLDLAVLVILMVTGGKQSRTTGWLQSACSQCTFFSVLHFRIQLHETELAACLATVDRIKAQGELSSKA
jgi:hypothetical protein